uniref:Uncharacterized protein n=1 Tax=Marseillevirus LCMAC102 TaxID=2506603 RepID=A0A481YUU0_9VIRU|nr:MAG: hypothetical protein LCMAC102_00990 [Marseillevirus LCMAC102]
MFLVATILLIAFTSVDGSCYCRKYVSGPDGEIIALNGGCNDFEMQSECKRAEWEMSDYVIGVMGYARTVALPNPFNTSMQDAQNFACLPKALEDRPVPDCATGLHTYGGGEEHKLLEIDFKDVRFDSIKHGLCVSEPLLKQCQMIKDGIPDYIDRVMRHLETCASQPFVEKMRLRIVNSVVPTITCKTTEAHLVNSSVRNKMPYILILFIVMMFL